MACRNQIEVAGPGAQDAEALAHGCHAHLFHPAGIRRLNLSAINFDATPRNIPLANLVAFYESPIRIILGEYISAQCFADQLEEVGYCMMRIAQGDAAGLCIDSGYPAVGRRHVSTADQAHGPGLRACRQHRRHRPVRTPRDTRRRPQIGTCRAVRQLDIGGGGDDRAPGQRQVAVE